MVGHLGVDVSAGHPHDEGFWIQTRTAALAGVHLVKEHIPQVDELEREVELAASNKASIIYSS